MKQPRANRLCSVILIACLSIFIISCGKTEPPLHTARLVTMGSFLDISIWGTDHDTAEQAISAIETIFYDLHHNWHAWQPSKLTRINEQLAKGEPVELEPDGMGIIQEADRLSRASDHLFNPAIGKLIALWGFQGDDRPQGPPPDISAITPLVSSHPTMDDLVITGTTLKNANPDVQLDFGAIAQGYAVDKAIALLRARGINNAIVNASGDLRAIGRHGERPWRVGIRHPKESGVIASVETTDDESVVTSGDYERFFDYEGTRYHHIIDPRTGYPAKGTTSVTVIHDNATTADAATTALLVAGPKLYTKIARQMGITKVMLIDDKLTVYMTPAMEKRLHFEIDPKPTVIISEPL